MPKEEMGLSRNPLDCLGLSGVSLPRNPLLAALEAKEHVAAERGEVLITGSVRSQKALGLIPRIVKNVEGVESLRCEIGIGSDWYW